MDVCGEEMLGNGYTDSWCLKMELSSKRKKKRTKEVEYGCGEGGHAGGERDSKMQRT